MKEVSMHDPKITMKDIAAEAGLSKGTVSKVINNRPGISEQVRRLVLNTCEKLNYRLDCNFQDLIQKSKNGATGEIGVVIAGVSFSDQAYAQIIDGVTAAAQNHNLRISLGWLSGDETRVFDLPPMLRDRRVSGFILTGRIKPELVNALRKLEMPFVILGNYRNDISAHTIAVETDIEHMIMKIVEAFRSEGKTRIACFLENPDNFYYRECLRIFKQSLHFCGLPFHEELMFWGDGPRTGLSQATKDKLLCEDMDLDAILSISYRLALEISQCLLYRYGTRNEPVDRVMLAATQPQPFFRLPLPTVFIKLQLKEMTNTAIKELLALRKGVPEPRRIIIRPEIIINRNCIIQWPRASEGKRK